MTLRIRPYVSGPREANGNDNPLADIENWPHRFQENPDRWARHPMTMKRIERDWAGGCVLCGESELSRIHLDAA
jgi:hypothetical protein